MKVAVVTPFYRTPPDWLAQCHASVRAQSHPCTHVLVSDGSGAHGLADFRGKFVELPLNHADFGDTPRSAGAQAAIADGCDAVAWLDADNWFLPRHVETLLRRHHETGAAVCTSARMLHALDGTLLGACDEVDGDRFADTNCMLWLRPALFLCAEWAAIPAPFHVVDDRWIWRLIRERGVPRAHSPLATVAYRTSWPHHYRKHGFEPPPGAKAEAAALRVDQARRELRDYLSARR
ncbi:MAG TPA: glycosyltransferase [Candidatus Binatia bacterium]|nr:glycosyltransferase [Candidatus Binatia bacterium]